MHEFKRRFPPPPSDWIRPRLADIADRVTSRNVERNPNVLTISAEFGLISQSEFFSRRVASESVGGYFLLERGDFAYNKSYSRGYPLGAIRRLDRYEKGCVSPLYICFRPRANAVDSDFLLHYLDGGAIDAGLADVAKEGVRNHGLLNVGVTDFFALEVPLPPVAEQRVTAQVLDTLDSTIRQTEAIIEKLKQVKQGLLHDLLTRGIDANGELRPPQRQAPHLYKESPLGWIPKAWATGELGSWLEGRPKNGYSPQPAGRWTGIQMLGLGCLTASGFEPRQLKDAPLGDPLVPRAYLNAGDLLMSRANTRDLVGLVGRYRDVGTPCCYPDLMMRLTPTAGVSASFLELVLRSPQARRQIQASASGTSGSMVKISSLIVMRLCVAIPTASEQLRVLECLDASDKLLNSEIAVVDQVQAIKSGLMDDLLTGRVRVTPLLTPASA